MSSGELTTYEQGEDGVVVVRLNRPATRNAINTPMLEQILAHLARAREDESVRVLVFSSTDERALSAGADVRESLEREGQIRKMELFSRVYDEVVAFAKPTVAVCHGSVVGGGAELAVACDIRVAGSNLGMRFPGGALGLPVGPARLVTLCGLGTAKYLLLTARTVGAEEALRLGLVSEVVKADQVEARALVLAGEIASHPPESMARLKRLLHEWDGIEERSRAEGEGQAAFIRDGVVFPGSDDPYS
ncbi:MAG TPA: enoyl-CoA hydratase/isomerase family protein [Solirubrobacterales bacterium]|nr:enoyl-CoA hydratase/isomerase family protein [Solirubrobacterales bacterium]